MFKDNGQSSPIIDTPSVNDIIFARQKEIYDDPVNKKKFNLINLAVHDLKTPVANVVTGLQVISSIGIEDPWGYYQDIGDAAQHTKNLLDALKFKNPTYREKFVNAQTVATGKEMDKDFDPSKNEVILAIISPYSEDNFQLVVNHLISERKSFDPGVDESALRESYVDIINRPENNHDLYYLYLSELSFYANKTIERVDNYPHSDAFVSDDDSNEALTELTGGLYRNAHLIPGMISEARELFLFDSIEPNLEATNINNLVNKCRSEIMELWNNNTAPISVDSPGPVTFNTDQKILAWVIKSLIDNAVKYGVKKDGDQIIRQPVDIKIDPRDDELVISVTDHGIGIEPDGLIKMNDTDPKPGRLVNGQKSGIPGTGFAIFRTKLLLADKLGGRLGVDSPGPDQGSTFSIHLPRR